jgi:hypothetical protein
MSMTTQGNFKPVSIYVDPNEPYNKTRAEVQRQLTGQAAIQAEIGRAYPKEPVKIRMVKGAVGTVLETGRDNALRAIANGNAELVLP